MTLLVAGLILFFGAHLLPLCGRLRSGSVERLGYVPYLALFSLVSLSGLILMIHGYARVGSIPLWTAPAFSRHLALLVMPIALFLVVAAYLPTRTRARLQHPMLLGTLLWSAVHLLANGDLASLLVFGSFLVYAVVDMCWSQPRETLVPGGRPRWGMDLLAGVVALLLYGALLHAHQVLFGVAVVA